MRTNKTYTLALTAIITALIYTATILTRVATPIGGIMHLGDFMIFVAVLTLPIKHAVFASSIGMVMVNILGGSFLWAPFTFFIKGTMAFIAAIYIKKFNPNDKKSLSIAFSISAIFMVISYFFAAIIIAHLLSAQSMGLMARILFALREVPSNLFQGGASVILGVMFSKVIIKIKNQHLSTNSNI